MGDETISLRSAEKLSIAHFELIDLLGLGSFGSVWKARDTKLDRTVAIKIPRKEQLNPAETEQFLREARAAAQLKHRNIVCVYEVGREDGQVYIVSDFVQGIDLADWLTGQQVSSREAAELCAKIADALHHAHEAGVIHRDLKPSNVILDATNEPHIMDFGLARREAGEITMTVEGRVLGTPAYMSPEQAQGEAHQADRRTDIYSLGVILFELLTGERPFRGNSRMLLHQVINDQAPSPRRLNGEIPRDLETICLKCLEKDAEKRLATAKVVSEELRRFLDGKPIHARPIGHVARTWRWSKRNPALAGLFVTLTLSLAVVTAVTIVAYRERKDAIKAHQLASDELIARKSADRQRAMAQVEALGIATAEGVPFLIGSIKFGEDEIVPLLTQVVQDDESDPVHRVHAAMALAQTGNVEADLLAVGIKDANPAECRNYVLALLNEPKSSIDSLGKHFAQAEARQDWDYMARLAIVALHIGDTSLASSMLQFENRPDPIQRTMFVETFPIWHGDLDQLAEMVIGIGDGALRSGICLGVGGTVKVNDEAQQIWEKILRQWYLGEPDSGTHSASGWALRNWKLPLPEIPEPDRQREDRDWIVTKMGLTMLRIRASDVDTDVNGRSTSCAPF